MRFGPLNGTAHRAPKAQARFADPHSRHAENLFVARASGEAPPVLRARVFAGWLLGVALSAPPVAARPTDPKAPARTVAKAAPVKATKTAPAKTAPVKATTAAPAKAAPAKAAPAKLTPAKAAPSKPASATVEKADQAPAPLAKSAPSPRPHENAYLEVPDRAFAESTLAYRYANLSDEEALAELARRRIDWVPAKPPLPGVRTPIRLAGPLRGVSIHSSLPPAERADSAFEILDARLALALDDFCALLGRHDIVELVHYTMYRPPAETPAEGQKPIRHPAGLAIDVGALRKRDGSWLAVGPHWPSNIGAKTCGDGAVEHWTREARELVSIVCEATDERLFHFALTPDFDAAHADHVHLEIKPQAHSFIVN